MAKEILFSYRDEGLYLHHTLTVNPSLDNFSFQSHSHNMYEIYLFLNGDGDFVIEGNIVPLKRGVMIFTLCGQTHNLLLKSDRYAYERVAILFSEKLFPKGCEELLELAANGGCVAELSENSISWLLENIEILKENAVTNLDKRNLSYSIINLVTFKLIGISKAVGHFEQAEGEDDLVKQIIRYIDRHLSENLSLDIIEKAMYRDKAYLGRRFKEVMGCSIWEYILRKRIFSARQQLSLTKSIADAFDISGFGDYSTFYRRYKKYVGVSPSEDLKQFTE